MTETTKQNFSILSITLLIAATFFLLIRFINPSFNRMKELASKIKETEEKIILLHEYKAKSESLIQSYLNLGDQIGDINLALPDNPQTAQVLATLDVISKNAGISLTTLTFQESAKDGENYLEIKTSFSATYENFKKWLDQVEKELRIMDLTKVNIKSVGQQKSQILEYNLTLQTYFLSDNSQQ